MFIEPLIRLMRCLLVLDTTDLWTRLADIQSTRSALWTQAAETRSFWSYFPSDMSKQLDYLDLT